ncbi:MAG: tRNA pseudouridine(38-40) synthase TruA, partial [Gammaproteobacteria bacterium]|nr:tRNA pseudouridine(38-40) synthase TruA [Gammaproteobacteria bacterium]
MRIALGIEYDGTGFFGWQRQPEGRTVQVCVEQALSVVADHPVGVVCAGRTDTGVHATGQVVHFDSEAARTLDGWRRGANAHLPEDIRVQWAHPVEESFHARFGATERHYRYIIHNHRVNSPLLRNRVCPVYTQLDVVSMQTAASYLRGEHDFTSFRAVACQAHSPVRTISRLEVCGSGDFIYLDVMANAFLHHMVRCIAGVLIAVGRGEQ